MTPLVHELAHLVDFVHGGVDGVPAEGVADGWRRAWDALDTGDLAGLGSYARTNAAELFAVATEHFFTDAAAVQAMSPSLAQRLHDTWGFTPATRRRRSSWWLMRRLLWSKLNGAF
jgi:Mlc titration factor MtfA (ptsG expression regulator)